MQRQHSDIIDRDAPWVTAWLARGSRKRLPQDAVLWTVGETALEAAMLVSGTLDVVRHVDSGDSMVLTTLEALNVVGEMGVLDESTHSATLVARTDCELSLLPAEEFRVFVRSNPEALEALLRQQSERLRALTRSVDGAWFDELTGLRNRRYLQRGLADEVERSRAGGSQLALAFIDIDHFKSINDTHGHACGDHALVTLARAMRQALPPGSTLVRQGGDEFVVLLPHVSCEAAVNHLRALADTVRTRPVLAGESVLTLTLSIGVAVFPDDADAPSDLLAAADRALYASKERGRDQVCARSDA